MDENNDGSKKPKQPFLRKGRGSAKFNKITYPQRKPTNEDVTTRTTESRVPDSHGPPFAFDFDDRQRPPSLSTSDFQNPQSLPQSSRTNDSGISPEGPSPYFEDEGSTTRPPTLTSLVEDIDHGHDSLGVSANHSPELHEEVVVVQRPESQPRVFARNPMSEATSASDDADLRAPSTNSSTVSAHARDMRLQANEALKKANFLRGLNSISITPSTQSGTSGLSTPLGASTPNDVHDEVTPYATSHRLFPTREIRPNLQHAKDRKGDAEAQTGASLLHRVRSFPNYHAMQEQQREANDVHFQGPVPERNLRQQQMFDLQTPVQRNENGNLFKNKNLDVPMANERVIRNLKQQLRDAIAHVDYVSEQQRTMGKEFLRHKAEFEVEMVRRMKVAEADFEQRREAAMAALRDERAAWAEDKQLAEDRLTRGQRQLEHDRRLLEKNESDRTKEVMKENADLRKAANERETRMAKMRVDMRTVEEKAKKKEEETESLKKEFERLKRINNSLEKNLRQARVEGVKLAKEAEAEARILANSSRRLNCGPEKENRPLPAKARGNLSERSRTRSVTWLDMNDSTQSFATDVQDTMHPVETGNGPTGPYTIYQNAAGEWTKVLCTIESGVLYQYHNDDCRWINRNRTVEINHYASDGTTSMELRLSNTKVAIRFFANGQLEVWRPHSAVSLVTPNQQQVRTELLADSKGFFVEIFDKSGVLTRRTSSKDECRNYEPNKSYSLRDGGSRFVDVKDVDDFEFVEPEFRLRWFRGIVVVCKLFVSKASTLRLELNERQVKMERVQLSAASGSYEKQLCFMWQRR